MFDSLFGDGSDDSSSFLTGLGQLATAGLGVYSAVTGKKTTSPTSAPISPGNPTPAQSSNTILYVALGGAALVALIFALKK